MKTAAVLILAAGVLTLVLWIITTQQQRSDRVTLTDAFQAEMRADMAKLLAR